MNLKEPGGAHAAADAHGDDRTLGLAPAPLPIMRAPLMP